MDLRLEILQQDPKGDLVFLEEVVVVGVGLLVTQLFQLLEGMEDLVLVAVDLVLERLPALQEMAALAAAVEAVRMIALCQELGDLAVCSEVAAAQAVAFPTSTQILKGVMGVLAAAVRDRVV